ncbi:hypothetical protein D0Z07_2975 [Hyphodiscus hymeniophilus]|uniref:Transcription factor RfeG n=1 Tax=Hyphodiscus hymeniophilus TaxID=353542 RepID=A0A9P6VMA6_9HELO|nr:hypothetical protein D0Z07_2975 [Hyphodiscus hymeniophilus]
MSSRRDIRDAERERDRERASRAQQQQAQARTNEYFVPKEGIDREVITADICRYLGNDALVRPGTYENPQTRQVQQGYFITAYRNLTTAMIADLKADSDRWDAERRQTASRGQPSNGIPVRDSNGLVRKSNTPVVEYRASTTHQSRQYYGPTETAPGATPGYPQPAAAGGQGQGVYDNGYQQGYNPSPAQYAQPSQAYPSDNPNYAYVATGADMVVDPRSAPRQPIQQAGPAPGAVPRQYTSSTTTYQPQVDTRGNYYSGQPPASAAQGYPSQQPADPFYGRTAPSAGAYSDSTLPDSYDSRAYQDPGPYSPAPISSTSSTTATSGSSRRDRGDREDRDRHHRSRR